MAKGRRGVMVAVVVLAVIALSGRSLAGSPSPEPAAPPPAIAGEAQADPGTVLVRMRPGLSHDTARSVASRLGLRVQKVVGATGYLSMSTEGKRPSAVVRTLLADGRVAHAELNHRVKKAAVPNDPLYGVFQPYLSNIGMPSAWDLSRGSPAVTIAVVDSGVDLDHPDLAGRLASGWDFVNGDSVPADDEGHGTMVAGIAAAATDNARGVAGVAWTSTILPVKVLNNVGEGTFSDVASGITFAADSGARVINLSFGASFSSGALRSAVDYALARGSVVVGAAGNERSSQPFYPAAYPGVMAVTATNHDGSFASSFSNFGPWVTIAAPGANLTSTAMGSMEQYATGSGTSFSAPVVAGAAALLLAQRPDLGQADVVARLRDTARDAGTPGFDEQYGYGIVAPAAALGGFTPPPMTAPADGEFHSLPPARVLDTRNGTGGTFGRVGPGQTIALQVAGAGGVPSSGVSAVVLNVTVTEPTSASYLTVYPAGEGRPPTSNLNFLAGQTVPNLVHVKVGDGGFIYLFNQSGATHVVADVAGWFSNALGSRGARFHPLTPSRIFDTRASAPVGHGQVVNAQVNGRGGVPPSGVSAVVMNVTVTEPTSASYLTAFPAGGRLPTASNLNFVAGQTVPNLVVVGVGTAVPGQVSFFNAFGRVHVVADVVGWYGDESNGPGALYRPISPGRILDTRTGTGGVFGKAGSGQSVTTAVTGTGGVPAFDVSAVVMNVTVTEPTAASYLTVYPSGQPVPWASNLNYVAGQTVPNLVVAKVGDAGRVSAYNAFGATHVVFDVNGWFTSP